MAEPNPKKIEFETKQKLLELVAENITCCYCKIVPREAPIFQKVYDLETIVCSSCANQNSEPYHRSVITRAFEKVLFELPRHCKFKKNGCKVALDLKSIEYHEEDCIHRDILCFHRWCSDVSSCEDLAEHLQSKHKVDVFGIPKQRIEGNKPFFRSFTPKVKKNYFFGLAGPFEQYEKRFFICMHDGFIWIMIYGSQFEAKNFKYTVKCEDPEFGTFWYKNYVKSLDDKKTDIVKSEKCMKIPFDLYWKYLGDKLEFEILIENLKKEEAEFVEDEFENPSNGTQPLKEIIDKAFKKALVKDDTWFLVESNWYGLLKKYL